MVSTRANRNSGKKFGRLTVLKHIKDCKYSCLCDCGNIKITRIGDLNRGSAKSCGCYGKEKKTKHGMSLTAENRAWISLKHRCLNKNNPAYKNYGGRGIKVCDSWCDPDYGFLNFFRDMGKKPSKEYTIDRINNDGDYEPSNCRWATRSEQSKNTRERNRINGKFAKIS